MSDIQKRIVKNSLAIYVCKMVNLIVTFFVFVHLANYFGESTFGQLSTAINFVAIFDILSNFGLNQILIRKLSSESGESPGLMGIGIALKAVTSFSAVVLANLCVPFMHYPATVAWVVGIVSLNLLVSSKLSSTRSIFESYFQSRLQMFYPVLYDILDNLIFAVLVILCTSKFRFGLIGVAILYTAANVPGCFLMIRRFFRTITVQFRGAVKASRPFLAESLPVAGYLLFSILNSQVDILLLSNLRPDSEVGYYSAAIRLVYPLLFLSTSFSMSLYPVLSSLYASNHQRFRQLYRSGLRIILWIATLTSMFGVLNGRAIVSTVYIASYAPAAASFQILIGSLGFIFLNFYYVDLFLAVGRQRVNTIVMAVSLLVNLGLNALFIPRYGFIGAGYAKLASSGVGFLLFNVLIFKMLDINALSLFLRFVPLWIAFACIGRLLAPLNLFINGSLSVLIFFGLSILFRVVTVKDVKTTLRYVFD
jgi:O-antigen/teichoic acid export membrane protein